MAADKQKPKATNARTARLLERLEELQCDPLELSAKIAMGQELDGPHPQLVSFRMIVEKMFMLLQEENLEEARVQLIALNDLVEDNLTKGYVPMDLRSKHIKDLMQYAYPKLSNVELPVDTGDKDSTKRFMIGFLEAPANNSNDTDTKS